MHQEFGKVGARASSLAWIAVPFLLYLALLQRLWFDAPIGDDFDAILGGTMALLDARSPGDWVGALFAQHNEHRIVVTRAAAYALAEVAGRIDFRVLTLLGNCGLGAIAVLLWAEFREAVGGPLLAGAAFLLCQLSFYEGALLSMAAISNIGVLAFALACLFFALRPGRASLAWAAVFGLLAAGSQGNGLFALPLAAAACALRGDRRRALVLAGVALLLWALFLGTYQRPPHHPSPLEALRHPLDAAHLFLVINGSIVPGLGRATIVGAILLAFAARLAMGGLWRRRPVAALWIAFIVLSAAAAAVGRVGFGVFYASRYAINASCLAAIVLLLLAERQAWPAAVGKLACAAAALASVVISWAAWPGAEDYAFRARLLAKAVAPPEVRTERYYGILHPDPERGARILARAEERGLYRAREVRVYGADPAALAGAPEVRRVAGHVDAVQQRGHRVAASGWSDLTAEVPGRVFAAWMPEPPTAAMLTATARTDVAIRTRDPRLLFSGFRWEADFATEEQARRAADALCLVVRAPGYGTTAFRETERACGTAAGRGQ